MDLSQKAAVDFIRLIWLLRRLSYCPVYHLTIRTHYSLDALDTVEDEQGSWRYRFLPLLIAVIATAVSAAAHHETILAEFVDESATNPPVSRGRIDTVSKEQIYLKLKDGGSFSVPIPMTNRFNCELEGKKWVETSIKGADRRWKAVWCVAGMKRGESNAETNQAQLVNCRSTEAKRNGIRKIHQ